MRNFTITELEWHNVIDKVQAIEKENEKLKGIIEGMNKAFSLYGVSKSFTAKQVADMLVKDFATIEEAIAYFNTIK